MSDLQGLVHTFSALARGRKATVIGIDGLGGAGKSTISEPLADALTLTGKSVFLLHIDDFIHTRAVRYRENVPAWQCYYELQWNYPSLLAVLEPLKQMGTYHGEVRLYEKETDTYRSQALDIPEGSIVIVEGVFLQRPELSGIFDYKIYLDIPEDVRLQRVLLRDGYIGDWEAIMEKYEQRYFPAERFYVETCHPADHAELVLKEGSL